MAWLNGWSYRKSHIISQTVDAGTNYQVGIKVYYGAGVDGTEVIGSFTAGKVYCNSLCRTDFGDIRFTRSDGTTLEDCWMEEKTDSNYALFWVEISGDLDAGNVSIYVYYGNAAATYPYLASDLLQGQGTFSFFDDFNDGVLGAWWTVVSGAPVEAGGTITINADFVQSVASMIIGHRFKARSKFSVLQGDGAIGTNIPPPIERILFWQYGAGAGNRRISTRDINAHCYGDILANPLAWEDLEYCWYVTGGVGQWVDYWIDNAFIAEHSAGGCVPDGLMPVRLMSSVNNPTFEVDWLFVAKFTSPEPVHSDWGEEETPPAAGAVAGFSIVPILQGIGILK